MKKAVCSAKYLRFTAAAVAAVMLFCFTGCGLITITDMNATPKVTDTVKDTPAPTPEEDKYKVDFDPNEVFESETERLASERIDGIIKQAVRLLNTLKKRKIGDGDLKKLDYSTLPKAKDSLKDPLAVKFYEEIEESAENFQDYYADHHDYGVDLFYSVTEATDALLADRQELFLYCDMKGSTDAYGTSYRLSYYMPNEWLSKVTDDVDAVKAAVELYYKVVDRIIEKMPAGLDNYEKCCYFIFVISLSTKYDYDQGTLFDMYQAYNVLINGNAVCRGYADALLELCRREGIYCEVVTGEAPSEGRHAWNAVETDEKRFYVDATWYDMDGISEDYREGKPEYLFMTEEELLDNGYVPD